MSVKATILLLSIDVPCGVGSAQYKLLHTVSALFKVALNIKIWRVYLENHDKGHLITEL